MQIFDSFRKLQQNYQKNITACVKNNNHLKGIFKENVEKFSVTNKRLEKLTRLFEEDKLKKNFDKIKDTDRKYAESTLLINNLEKNLFGKMLKNVLNENEDEVKKNEKTKNALLICLRNVLKNLDLNNVEENETKEGIDYLTEKYKDLLKNDEKKGDEKLARLHKLLGMII